MVNGDFEDSLGGFSHVEPNDGDTMIMSPEQLQSKLYFYVDQLKRMHAEIPGCFQSRMSYELLNDVANSLLSGTVFAIVRRLMEIQHVTESNLLVIRQQLVAAHVEELEEWASKLNDSAELRNILTLLKDKHAKELNDMDLKLVALLDQKVLDQQTVMEQAGVAGFYATTNPKDIKIQMFLLDFILRLSQMQYQ